jgi:hypothetical protein
MTTSITAERTQWAARITARLPAGAARRCAKWLELLSEIAPGLKRVALSSHSTAAAKDHRRGTGVAYVKDAEARRILASPAKPRRGRWR